MGQPRLEGQFHGRLGRRVVEAAGAERHDGHYDAIVERDRRQERRDAEQHLHGRRSLCTVPDRFTFTWKGSRTSTCNGRWPMMSP
eukprot:4526574-Prymnesium_polylepis.1